MGAGGVHVGVRGSRSCVKTNCHWFMVYRTLGLRRERRGLSKTAFRRGIEIWLSDGSKLIRMCESGMQILFTKNLLQESVIRTGFNLEVWGGVSVSVARGERAGARIANAAFD